MFRAISIVGECSECSGLWLSGFWSLRNGAGGGALIGTVSHMLGTLLVVDTILYVEYMDMQSVLILQLHKSKAINF